MTMNTGNRSMHRWPGTCRCVLASAAIVALLAPVSGCGDGRPARVPVAGQVLIDGQPLPNAMLAFYPESGRPSHANCDESGKFVLECFGDNDGAQIGKHQVAVTAVEQLSPTQMKWFAPKKYNDPRTSGLEYQIDEPTDDLKIELTWSGGAPYVERSGGGD